VEEGTRQIAKLIEPRPLSAEVTTNDLGEMMEQARRLASLADNVVIKIPHENEFGEPCYGVIHKLEKEGIRVNATAALSFGQVVLGAKAGATYISVFAGRVTDEGGNASEVIENSVGWLEAWDFKSRLIVGSIRSVGDVLTAVLAGAHIVTVPPQFLDKMADHKYTRDTVKGFIKDAQSALKMMNNPPKQ